ncbi:hypothetical protein N8311_01300 [bacterium]|nr:hypothetical protein [bacterium]
MSFLKLNLMLLIYLLTIIGCLFVSLLLFEKYTSINLADELNMVHNPKSISQVYGKDTTISTMYFDLPTGSFMVLGPQKIINKDIKTEWIKYKDGFTMSTNKFGFITEFPVDNYPKKKPNEYRILLVGGSGGQGWGAQTNEQMFHNQTEKMLNNYFENKNISVDIINLSQAGTTIFNSSEILHVYGKHLNADMIISYIGVNDISQIMNNRIFVPDRSYGNYPSDRFTGYKGASYMNKFRSYFPTITLAYGLQDKVSDFMGIPRVNNQSLGVFNRQHIPNVNEIDPTIFYKDYLVPKIVDELKSIKREFCGIPMVLVKQLWFAPPWANLFLERVRKINLNKDTAQAYDYWWEELEKKLPGYVNNEWHFLNAEKALWGQIKKTSNIKIDENTWGFGMNDNDDPYKFTWLDGKEYYANKKSIGAHLDNTGHYLLADYLSTNLETIIENRKKIKCSDLYIN